MVKHMGISPETGPESASEVSVETTEGTSKTPFDFSEAAVVVMKRLPDLAREMWRALLRGEAGQANRSYAMLRLHTLFWDMIDGATLSDDRNTSLMVEELIKEFDPEYKKHMDLQDRPGLELSFVLPNPYEEGGSSGFDMAG